MVNKANYFVIMNKREIKRQVKEMKNNVQMLKKESFMTKQYLDMLYGNDLIELFKEEYGIIEEPDDFASSLLSCLFPSSDFEPLNEETDNDTEPDMSTITTPEQQTVAECYVDGSSGKGCTGAVDLDLSEAQGACGGFEDKGFDQACGGFDASEGYDQACGGFEDKGYDQACGGFEDKGYDQACGELDLESSGVRIAIKKKSRNEIIREVFGTMDFGIEYEDQACGGFDLADKCRDKACQELNFLPKYDDEPCSSFDFKEGFRSRTRSNELYNEQEMFREACVPDMDLGLYNPYSFTIKKKKNTPRKEYEKIDMEIKIDVEEEDEKDTEKVVEKEAEKVVEKEAEKVVEKEAEKVVEKEAETDTEVETEVEAEKDPEVETEKEMARETETETETEIETETEREIEGETELETEKETEIETEVENGQVDLVNFQEKTDYEYDEVVDEDGDDDDYCYTNDEVFDIEDEVELDEEEMQRRREIIESLRESIREAEKEKRYTSFAEKMKDFEGIQTLGYETIYIQGADNVDKKKKKIKIRRKLFRKRSERRRAKFDEDIDFGEDSEDDCILRLKKGGKFHSLCLDGQEGSDDETIMNPEGNTDQEVVQNEPYRLPNGEIDRRTPEQFLALFRRAIEVHILLLQSEQRTEDMEERIVFLEKRLNMLEKRGVFRRFWDRVTSLKNPFKKEPQEELTEERKIELRIIKAKDKEQAAKRKAEEKEKAKRRKEEEKEKVRRRKERQIRIKKMDQQEGRNMKPPRISRNKEDNIFPKNSNIDNGIYYPGPSMAF
ncbi:DgyrCDS9445 [Dimorphilus gyrociliatus]|uniref:DgyrCDS9445 n=1 Tax=Dimorphilus gyrociliatus TaxID=2664684 RepID=A0A7I8VZP7_9ANNE|nr:DgyrCDS9445 [Dimorphilus gyrociliatus]